MLAKIYSFGLQGIDGYSVSVEIDINNGLPGTEIVGLPNTATKESKERVRSALKNSGFRLTPKRITVNLAPADTKKEGSYYDLPIALGIMLLVDGIGKMPLAVDALSVYSPYRFWVLISAVLPLILGIVLLVNPFRAAKAAIMFFGISILADGLFELITYIQQRRAEKSEYKDIR